MPAHIATFVVIGLLVLVRVGGTSDSLEMDAAVRAMFADCDSSGDGKLDMPEMVACIRRQAPADIVDKVEPSYYFRTFDTNKNGYLDFEEFSKAVKPGEDVEYEVKTRDGKTKMFTQQELSEKTLESTKGVRMEDGHLVKDDEGTSTLDELINENPNMARVVVMGNFATDLLNHSGTIPGRLKSLKTLRRDGEGAQDGDTGDSYEEFLPGRKQFQVFFHIAYFDFYP